MREKIDWFNMDSGQRNQIIHEKVMQASISQEQFPIPRYTTSMDDAWLVVEKIWNDIRFGDGGSKEGRKERLARYYQFDKDFLRWQLTGLSREQAANEICSIALHAIGYEFIYSQDAHPLEPAPAPSSHVRQYPDLEGE